VLSADDLNWDDLRYFLRAAHSKTLAGAARAVGVKHSTIGRRLSALERSLGAALVLRGPEGLTLTPLGERVLPLVHDLERDVLAVLDLAASQMARVRLAIPSGFTNFFAPRLAQFRQEHPTLSLELFSGPRPVDLKRGEADLAVRVGPVKDEDLVTRKLGDVGWSLYASKEYLARHPGTVDPADLTGHEVIGYGAGLATVPAAKWIDEHAANATIVLHSSDSAGMLDAAVAGVGLAVLPCYLADAESSLTRLTPEVLATRNVSLVYCRESRLAEPVRMVIRFVVEVMHEHVHTLGGMRGGH
jgi:DNA-binding transcriptional LysR family regulator